MTTHVTPNLEGLDEPIAGGVLATGGPASYANRWEGRAFGALVLAAFLLYGIGSAQAEHPAGWALVSLNSVAVTIVGVIGFRLLGPRNRKIGSGYLAARLIEAIALAGGVAVLASTDAVNADTTGYLMAMVALGLGSVPFCHALGRGHWLPAWLAHWGVVGYALLTTGALVELATGRGVTVLFAVPGGLFELVLGLYLVRRGFARPVSYNE